MRAERAEGAGKGKSRKRGSVPSTQLRWPEASLHCAAYDG